MVNFGWTKLWTINPLSDMHCTKSLTVFDSSAFKCFAPEPVLHVTYAAPAPGCLDQVFLARPRLVAHDPIAVAVLVIGSIKVMLHAKQVADLVTQGLGRFLSPLRKTLFLGVHVDECEVSAVG